jgi:flagellar hook-basal body complex protein FliE
MRIDSVISGVPDIGRLQPLQKPGETSGTDAFRSLLDNAVNNVGMLQSNAAHEIQQFMTGEQQDPHRTVMAVQEAGLAFDFFMQARNKVVQAYQEIMRMAE